MRAVTAPLGRRAPAVMAEAAAAQAVTGNSHIQAVLLEVVSRLEWAWVGKAEQTRTLFGRTTLLRLVLLIGLETVKTLRERFLE